MKQRFCILSITLLFFVLEIAIACGRHQTKTDDIPKSLPDTLRVATLYSPTSYFLYKEESMGYEYDLISKFAKDKGIVLDLKIAKNLNAMIEMLDSCEVDVIAYEVPFTAEYNNKVLHCGIENITYQVLVQPKIRGEVLIHDVTDLVGKTVYVENESKYMYRLQNLNDELGGGIEIKSIDKDTLITEDLIKMVSEKIIPLTVVDSDIAKLNQTYFNDLDISLNISLEQKASWAVNPRNKWLADSINAWAEQIEINDDYKQIHKRYFELSKISGNGISENPMIGNGVISGYDTYFKTHSKEIGWDWRILAAQAYTESRFDTTVVSWAGARGIMQIMPRTATANGLPLNKITDPNLNIKTAVKVLKSLNNSLAKKVPDSIERQKFILAAYNSGLAHILDAIALAAKYGKQPDKWEGNVREAVLMKSRPEYYNDPVVKYGYFRGTQTVEYVDKVMRIYKIYQDKIPL